MFTVYRIFKVPSATNEFTTGRTETWTMKIDKEFDNEPDALEYTCSKNLSNPILRSSLTELSNDEAQDIAYKFCFSGTHLYCLEYILGGSGTNSAGKTSSEIAESIRRSLQLQGIRVVKA